MTLPPCGLYRTTRALASVPAGRLVYFHNHGDPGPGLYLPASWALNRASWQPRGSTLSADELAEVASGLFPLRPEGLYAVTETFTCCARACTVFAPGQLVQVGYDGEGHPIVFLPEWAGEGLRLPDRGTQVDNERLRYLSPLKVSVAPTSPQPTPGGFVH